MEKGEVGGVPSQQVSTTTTTILPHSLYIWRVPELKGNGIKG
jgi:hypothetical protein